MFYFAYGSNLDCGQMRERCPSARFVAVAKLGGHSLAFTRKSRDRNCGVADVVPAQDQCAWGAVYEIHDRDIARLDVSEGYLTGRTKNASSREERHVEVDGDPKRPLLAWIYFATREEKPPLPNAEYKRLIVDGARFWHLPDDYISELEKIEVAG
jgi:gamma-glutamylcyclotransferase (GGCT)/AIG2-like uncharacterized protein YtfP